MASKKNWHSLFLPSEIFTMPPFSLQKKKSSCLPSCGIHKLSCPLLCAVHKVYLHYHYYRYFYPAFITSEIVFILIIIITTIISPQSLAITFWTILESTLAVLAFLQFSHFLLVLCSPLSLGKACGGSSCSGTAFTIFSFEIAHVFYYDIIDLSIDNNIEYHLVLSMNW